MPLYSPALLELEERGYTESMQITVSGGDECEENMARLELD